MFEPLVIYGFIDTGRRGPGQALSGKIMMDQGAISHSFRYPVDPELKCGQFWEEDSPGNRRRRSLPNLEI